MRHIPASPPGTGAAVRPVWLPEPGAPAPRVVYVLSAAVVVVLVVFASRYGYHRDELYFLAAGRHLAWGYADQGPLTPFIARVMSALDGTSLTVLRVPAALMAGGTTLLTGKLAREFGGRPRAQALATACAAVSVIVLFTGHTLSTTTFDILDWTAATLLAVRALRPGSDRLWLLVGVVLGVGLLNKPLPAFLGVALLAGIVISGPRWLLRSGWVWGAVVIAAVLGSPFVIWQAMHGWPQLSVSRSIAAGGSASSQPWWLIVPFQPLLAGPLLAPVWIAGLVRLFRDPSVRAARFLAWAWLVLAVVFMASGGKPYYLAGLLPALLGAGSVPSDRWLDGSPARRRVTAAIVALSAAAGLLIALPVLPARDAGPVIAMNPDVGETIGWPDLVHTVARVAHRLPRGDHPVILTENYGEAGAIDRFGPALRLPHAYSGHNAYGYWGPPPAGSAPVIAIGFDPYTIGAQLAACRVAAHVRNSAAIGNDENGKPVFVCTGPRRSWPTQWPHLRHLG